MHDSSPKKIHVLSPPLKGPVNPGLFFVWGLVGGQFYCFTRCLSPGVLKPVLLSASYSVMAAYSVAEIHSVGMTEWVRPNESVAAAGMAPQPVILSAAEGSPAN